MKKISENDTNRILKIWKNMETPILYICLPFPYFCKYKVLIYFNVIWNCVYFGSIMAFQKWHVKSQEFLVRTYWYMLVYLLYSSFLLITYIVSIHMIKLLMFCYDLLSNSLWKERICGLWRSRYDTNDAVAVSQLIHDAAW